MRTTLAALTLLLAHPGLAQAPVQVPKAVPLPPPPAGLLPIRPAPAPPPSDPPGLSAEEARACAREVEVVERRLRLFHGQGLSTEEAARRNAPAQKQLAECVAHQREERAIQAEIAARTRVGAGTAERARVEREVRLAHARVKPDDERSQDERRLLAEERDRLERERLPPPPAAAPPSAPTPADREEVDPEASRRDLALERGLSAEEAAACRSEVGVLEQRRRVLGGQLTAAEARRRNAPHEQALADCLARHRREARQATQERQVLADIAARTPAMATERERDRIAHEVRLAHARAKGRDERTEAERALVAEAEVAEARRREVEARLRDPLLKRRALSGLQCAHQSRRDRARQELAEEERIAALGGGDKQRAYFLRAELRRDEEVLRQNGLELQAAGGALPCSERLVGRVARCVDARIDGRPLQDCDSEEMQLALSALVR